ncbi:MAG TPA: TatD family hydrolase [Clostridia bacterium]|nr:TatD family hydrolase [Clostridia bacterium]
MIDCHAHLDDKRYDRQRERIIADFVTDGVDFVINSASDYVSITDSLNLAKKYQRIYATVGLHPSCIAEFNAKTAEEMINIARHEKVAAVGEIGLDYHYPNIDKKAQKDAFAAQIELADKCGLPVVIHTRDAWADTLDIMKAQNNFLTNGVMFHCYNGSEEITRMLADKDYFFSFGGALTYTKAAKRTSLLYAVPIGQIVTETDAPYLAPEPYRGQLNYPKYVKYVLPILADAYGLSVGQIENQIDYNAKKFFKKIK